ncbi:MAG: histidine kinase dimerization/phospho-acceptor domain-containing protein [Candidatus Tantalella remota]|nr:histidine kinase dimerization/phospho-acceptor domain-containing protein [Candidatus Tantalella remota]
METILILIIGILTTVVTIRNIILKNKAKDELNKIYIKEVKRNIEVHEINELKTKFLGIAAHDLRGPLAMTKTAMEVIRDALSVGDTKRVTKFMEIIERKVSDMKDLIDDFLDVTKIVSG